MIALLLFLLLPSIAWGQMSGRDVQWDQIRNMPPGFKDGVDNVTPFEQDFYSQTGETIASATFMPLEGASHSAKSSFIQNLIARTGVLSNLACRIHAPAGPGTEWTVTLHKEGGPTSLGCSINNPTFTCRDSAHFVPIAVGDLVYYAITQTGTPTPTHFTCTTRFTE
jgi:hypothetical protein